MYHSYITTWFYSAGWVYHMQMLVLFIHMLVRHHTSYTKKCLLTVRCFLGDIALLENLFWIPKCCWKAFKSSILIYLSSSGRSLSKLLGNQGTTLGYSLYLHTQQSGFSIEDNTLKGLQICPPLLPRWRQTMSMLLLMQHRNHQFSKFGDSLYWDWSPLRTFLC